jgi:methionyl-tRNA formyltransferase
MQNKLKIVFFGSQDFSLKFLKFFLEELRNNIEILAVVTRAAKEAGRGKKILKTKVHEFIEENYSPIPVLTPKTLRNFDFSQEILQNGVLERPDFNFVVSYGLIIPKNVIEFPRLGSLNIHPSDLPLYRGAAPIERTLMDGMVQTKSILMFMDEGLDTGDIVDSTDIEISLKDNCSSLKEKIFEKAKGQILKVFENPELFLKNKKSQALDKREPTYAHKISHIDKIVDFSEISEELGVSDKFHFLKIYNKIRALDEIGLTFVLKNLDFHIKIFEASFEKNDDFQSESLKIGFGIVENKIFKIVCQGGGKIIPSKIRKDGGSGKILSNREFLNGLKI